MAALSFSDFVKRKSIQCCHTQSLKKVIQRKGNVIEGIEKLSEGWLKFPFDPDKISLGGKWFFPQNMYQILVP
jgi:hypothetical protein